MMKKGLVVWKTVVINTFHIIKTEKEKIFKNSLKDLWDNIKHTNISETTGSQMSERKGQKNLFEETMVENFPNLVKETDILVWEAQSLPNKINPKLTPNIIISVTS